MRRKKFAIVKLETTVWPKLYKFKVDVPQDDVKPEDHAPKLSNAGPAFVAEFSFLQGC